MNIFIALWIVSTVIGSSFQAESVLPRMTPDQREIVLQEGEEIRVSCFAEGRPVHFSVHHADEDETVPMEEEKPKSSGDDYALFRAKANRSDTGWYGCAEEDVDLSIFDPNSKPYDSKNARWIYIYVNSSEPFARSHSFVMIIESIGRPAVLPCHPTSPDKNVTCSLISDSSKVRTRFEPKVGCIVEDFSLTDQEMEFSCTAEGYSESNTYTLHAQPSIRPLPPMMKIIGSHHIVWGQEFRINCSIEPLNQLFSMIWSYPESISKDRVEVNRGEASRQFYTEQLTVRNVEKSDAGKYVCKIKTLHETSESEKIISVYDPKDTYINMTMQRRKRHFEVKKGRKVQWVVRVKAYPRANYTWFGPDGEELCLTKGKYKMIKRSRSRVILRIRNLELTDSGTYMLRATSKAMQKTINVTLRVEAQPIVEIQGFANNSNQDTPSGNVTCRAVGSPRPNINWSFENCAGSSCNEIVANVTKKPNMVDWQPSNFETYSRLNRLPEGPFRLVCESCNRIGCEKASKEISVANDNEESTKSTRDENELSSKKRI